MDGSLTSWQTKREDVSDIQDELDRKVFYFKALFETARELGGLIQPRKIMDTFLLMGMGPLGISHGLVSLINTATLEMTLASRGFSESEILRIKESLPQACDQYFPEKELSTISPPRIQVITADSMSAHHTFLPAQIRTLIMWSLEEGYSGFIGLGAKISGEALSGGDLDVLLNLTNTLLSALSRAISTVKIQQLNSDLQKQNSSLQTALDQAREASDELDKRVYHLKSLSDLNSELSPIIQSESLLEAFLLVAMGALGVSQGFVIAFDRQSGRVKFAGRRVEQRGDLSADVAERLLYKCFDASRERSLAPMSISHISSPSSELFAEAVLGIDPASALLYVIDQNIMGLVVFGPTVAGSGLSEEEEELLATHTGSFMVYLKNVQLFERVQVLNEDLTLRNEELRKTIVELTEARHTIDILERARARIRSLIQREAERTGRVSPIDLSLMFLIATILGVLFNLVSPQGIPIFPEVLFQQSSPRIEALEAKVLLDDGKAILVDARPKELYSQKHVKNAVNLPPALFDIIYMMKLGDIDQEKSIIVYGRSISKLYDEEISRRLRQRDHDDVKILIADFQTLESYGYQVEQ